jgi:hypothetical protein
VTKFSPVKPQRWAVSSFEHYGGPHGIPGPDGRNIVISDLTSGVLRPGIAAAPVRCGERARSGVGYRDRMAAGTFWSTRG